MAVVFYIHARYTPGLNLAGRYDGRTPGLLRFELSDSEWTVLQPILAGRGIPFSVLTDGGKLQRHNSRIQRD
jgi:hypothetical protein